MFRRTPNRARLPGTSRLTDLVPPTAVVQGLFVLGTRGSRDPLAIAFFTLIAVPALALTIARVPLLLLWLIPVSMSVFYYAPVLHYEGLVLLVSLLLGLSAIHRFQLEKLRLEAIELRYLLFICTALPGIFFATSLWRFGATTKIYILGLLAYEVARRGAARFGGAAMLWGPTAFAALTALMLVGRALGSGVPGFKAVLLRVYLTNLSWGTSNYVAAVLVLLLPTLVLLVRSTQHNRLAHIGAALALVGTLGSILMTTSRGGAVLAGAYLAWLAARARRSVGPTIVVAASLAVVMLATPFGQGLAHRFTSTQGFDSIVFRWFIWQAAFHRGITHLPFGVGAGQGLIQADRMMEMDSHNFLLTLFSEMGPLAVLAWLWLFAALWDAARRATSEEASREFGTAMKATIALAFANMLFEPTLTGNLYHLLFWWLIGIFRGSVVAARRSVAQASVG